MLLRLDRQLLARLTSRDLTKFGMAIANKMPMMSTTIIISTRVNPFRIWWRARFMINSSIQMKKDEMISCRTIPLVSVAARAAPPGGHPDDGSQQKREASPPHL